ncbi:aminotransferase class IV [Ktedonosporobacter rubrisoli]|nr:aminotransferase class IV [Ktedonosporobacter rubrisoli]
MSTTAIFRMELNGAPVQLAELQALWQSKSYGHFSVLPVHNKRVRGLHLHLTRLQNNTQILFDHELDTERLRTYIRKAVANDTAPLMVRVEILARQSIRTQTIGALEPDILVSVRDLSAEAALPLRIQTVQYQRDLPQVKHAGTCGLNYQYRLAQLNGFDDALFTDPAGHISEGSAWNIGFFDGRQIIWPDASVLPGIAMQLIQAKLRKKQIPFEVRPVHLREIPKFRAAFLTHVLVGAQPIASIDDIPFEIDIELNKLLKACYEANPEEEI